MKTAEAPVCVQRTGRPVAAWRVWAGPCIAVRADGVTYLWDVAAREWCTDEPPGPVIEAARDLGFDVD